MSRTDSYSDTFCDFDDTPSTDESAHTYTINWGDTSDGSDDSTASVVPGESSGIIGHNYLNTGVYNITVTDADSSDVGGYETNFSAPAPVVTPAYEQVIGPGQTVTLASFSGAGANAIAYVNWTGGAGPSQPATVVPDGDGDGGGTITATAPSIPGAYTPSITLYQPDMENGYGFVEYGGGFSADVVTVSSTVDVWGVKIDNGESNDLLIASSDGTQNLQDLTVYFPHPAGEALDLTLTTSDDSEDQVWDPTLGTVGTDAALVLGEDSSGTLHSSYSFSVGPDVYYKEFEVGATAGDATLNVLSFALSGSADSGASTSTFNTEVSGGDLGATGTTGATGSASKVSDAGIALVQVNNPNIGNGINSTDVTDNKNNNGNPTNWLVGQEVDLKAVVTAPVRPLDPDYAWEVPGDVLTSYATGGQKSIETQLDTGPQGVLGQTPQEIRFFWVSVVGQPETNVVSVSCEGANGAIIHAYTKFNVYEPTITTNSVAQGAPAIATNPPHVQPAGKVLGIFKTAATKDGIDWTANVSEPAGVGFAAGGFFFVQKVNNNIQVVQNGPPVVKKTVPLNGSWALDAEFPYDGGNADEYNRASGYALDQKDSWTTGTVHTMGDSPQTK